jgi:hypothetical protein
MQYGRFEFKDQNDLLDYLTNAFQLPSKEKSPWRISRKGKYQRVDEKDNPIFTFGDPIVDLITNRHGITIIKGEVYDVRDLALRMDGRRGGVHTIDFGPYVDIEILTLTPTMIIWTNGKRDHFFPQCLTVIDHIARLSGKE